MIIAVFVIALLATVVAGMLQLNTEELQVMQNHVNAQHALCVAEAGLNDAFKELRTNSSWTSGFTNKGYNGGSYTVTVSGSLPNLTVESTATSEQGYVARVRAELAVSTQSPYLIQINDLRVNE